MSLFYKLIKSNTNDDLNIKLSLWGITIYKTYIKNGFIYKKWLLGLRWERTFKNVIEGLTQRVKVAEPEVKNIWVLSNQSGETSLLLVTIKEDRAVLNNTIFIATKPYHVQLIEIFLPGAKYFYMPEYFGLHLKKDSQHSLFCKGVQVKIVQPLGYFIKYEQELQHDVCKSHFYHRYCQATHILNKKTELKYPDIQEKDRNDIYKKLSNKGVRRPFVLISNETWSNLNLSDAFYQKLSFELSQEGYDVVFNSRVVSEANLYGHVIFLSLNETIALAKEAAWVIGIRSGLMDVIYPYSDKMIVIYTAFRDRGKMFPELKASCVFKAFSLKQLPIKKDKNKYLKEIIFDTTLNQTEELLITEVISCILVNDRG